MDDGLLVGDRRAEVEREDLTQVLDVLDEDVAVVARLVDALGQLVGREATAEGGTTEEALKDLGVFCKGLVQQEIVDGGFVANKPSTIKKKKSEQPLIDTGHMRQSVDFVIKERGD